ncbi:hypothetical protein U1Q18_004409 [Sarracenia purpurea var. burkii]
MAGEIRKAILVREVQKMGTYIHTNTSFLPEILDPMASKGKPLSSPTPRRGYPFFWVRSSSLGHLCGIRLGINIPSYSFYNVSPVR